ncbi:MAG: UDP-N-acetylmuramate--L-alanine ligase [Syntrophomonadaceae bacterium]
MPVTPGLWVHMVGIAGAGMSGIARVLAIRGFKVSGSDLQKNAVTDRLEELGIELYQGHSASNIKEGINLVVISSAIPPDNPELVKAIQYNIPIMKRGQMLAELVNSGKGIAVAGAHGKTTTTSMIYSIMEQCGLDPTFIVGGELKESGINAKVGKSPYAVVEADESDASFLELRPYIAVVTNIEDDHLDYYKNLHNIELAFEQFLCGVRSGGFAVLYGEDPCIKNIKPACPVRTLMYGESPDNDYCLSDWQAVKGGSQFFMHHQGTLLGKVQLGVPGKHNALNAIAALATVMELGVDFDAACRGLNNFVGAKRRFQYIGTARQVEIVDDYAHHPTEIKATIDAARSIHPGRIIVAFQPHRYSRTKSLGTQLGEALFGADICLVTEIYAASENPIPGIDGNLVARAACQAGGQCSFYPDLSAMEEHLLQILQPGDLLITMGAGDIWRLGNSLLEKLAGNPIKAC